MSTKKQLNARYRQRLIAAGTCLRCGRAPAIVGPRGGTRLCEACRAERCRLRRAQTRAWTRAGLCKFCGAEPVLGAASCLKHLLRVRQHVRTLLGSQPHVVSGLGRPPVEGTEEETG